MESARALRLRLAAVLPPALAGRAQELPARTLLALRFASDAELQGPGRSLPGR